MSPKTGRPHSYNPRQMRVEVKMTSDELEKLDFCCKYVGKSRSELIRDDMMSNELTAGQKVCIEEILFEIISFHDREADLLYQQGMNRYVL